MFWTIFIVVAVTGFYFVYSYNRAPEKNINYTQYKMPDLRLSDDAPDWYAAKNASHEYEAKEPERKAARRREEILKGNAEDEEIMQRYWDELKEAKAKRWREGNPVTPEKPLKPHEKPYDPSALLSMRARHRYY